MPSSERRASTIDVAKEIGLHKNNFTEWKKGRSKPSAEAQQLADYFDVSVDYLLGRSNLREPLVTIAAHTDDRKAYRLKPRKRFSSLWSS